MDMKQWRGLKGTDVVLVNFASLAAVARLTKLFKIFFEGGAVEMSLYLGVSTSDTRVIGVM